MTGPVVVARMSRHIDKGLLRAGIIARAGGLVNCVVPHAGLRRMSLVTIKTR